MILTGPYIGREVENRRIVLDPFTPDQLNPNSYNYRLGRSLKVFDHFDGEQSQFLDVQIPEQGIVLEPGTLYLGHTLETIGSDHYAMSLIGRSSIGRLGLFLQVSANLGHTTSAHRWTLELYATRPIRVYPEMVIGQVSFWTNHGEIRDLGKTYAHFSSPHETVAAAMIPKE
ncbi:deoxycytidine deaminase [Streptomyces venezuelae]|uniref:dCTP deaminase n=1 Tax=Streptomyces venezuelae TaxID=54571 RepID=UPI003648EC35